MTNRPLMIIGGIALWLPLLFSFLGGLSLARLPGAALSQMLMVALLVMATLLLGLLIGRSACLSAGTR
jgi:thiosulfate reductase cytochrome b subunit